MNDDEHKGGPDEALAAMRRERDAARKELRELSSEVERLRPFETQATDLAGQVAELSKSLDGAKSGHAIDIQLARAGFDDAGALVAKALHAAAGDDAPAFGEWLSSLTPETAPKPLQPYLAQPAAAPQAPPEAPAPAAAPAPAVAPQAPRPGVVADASPSVNASVSVDALRVARQRLKDNPSDPSAHEHLQETLRAFAAT